MSISHPKIRFMYQYFLLLNTCIAEKNSFTQHFCQSLYSPRLLHKILKLQNLDIKIKYCITDYLFESFIYTDIGDKINQVYIIEHILDSLCYEFETGIKTLLDSSLESYELSYMLVVDETNCKPY
jgi:hypothetical protein